MTDAFFSDVSGVTYSASEFRQMLSSIYGPEGGVLDGLAVSAAGTTLTVTAGEALAPDDTPSATSGLWLLRLTASDTVTLDSNSGGGSTRTDAVWIRCNTATGQVELGKTNGTSTAPADATLLAVATVTTANVVTLSAGARKAVKPVGVSDPITGYVPAAGTSSITGVKTFTATPIFSAGIRLGGSGTGMKRFAVRRWRVSDQSERVANFENPVNVDNDSTSGRSDYGTDYRLWSTGGNITGIRVPVSGMYAITAGVKFATRAYNKLWVVREGSTEQVAVTQSDAESLNVATHALVDAGSVIRAYAQSPVKNTVKGGFERTFLTAHLVAV